MQIPPQKKTVFYAITAAVFIAGIIIGVFFISYVFYKFKEPLCSVSKLPDIQKVVDATTGKFAEKVASLQPGTTVAGKVSSKESSEFSIETIVVNPLDTRNSTTTTIRIPFDSQKDQVMILKSPVSKSAPATSAPGTFGDIKTGQQLIVKILQDGKKTVYILPAQ